MKTNIVVLLAFFCSFNLQAYSNFIENPYTPYPPGCATLPDLQTALHGDNVVKFFEQVIPVDITDASATTADALVTAYRVACADANRSVIWLAFNVPEGVRTGAQSYSTPKVVARLSESMTYSLSLAREPNSWDVGNHPSHYEQVFGFNDDWFKGWGDGHDKTWIFVLDAVAPINDDFVAGYAISPTQYNGSFTLKLQTRDGTWDIQVPSTASLFASTPRVPLSGRLSGNWVVEGASDQGFVIAVSEVVPDSVPEPTELLDSSLLMFLSWYTYDTNGDKLWLTGSAQFAMGATEVTIPIEDVSNGEFMGSKKADRSVVGSVTITGNNCNDLSLQYNLTDIGLGSGTKRLERLFSLETAGYVCRDLEARIATK